MKLMKKISMLMMPALLFFVMTGGSVSATTETKLSEENEELTKDQKELALALQDHLDDETDSNGNKQVKIINPDELENKLNDLDTPLSFEEFQSSINKFNTYMADPNNNIVKETSDEIAEELEQAQTENVGGIETAAITCSDALTIIGFIHSGSYAAAAAALGLSAGVSFAIPLIVNAAYSAASIACD